eukprot:jgi/Botrbrau1/14182/Bobra.182_3s0115.1
MPLILGHRKNVQKTLLAPVLKIYGTGETMQWDCPPHQEHLLMHLLQRPESRNRAPNCYCPEACLQQKLPQKRRDVFTEALGGHLNLHTTISREDGMTLTSFKTINELHHRQ